MSSICIAWRRNSESRDVYTYLLLRYKDSHSLPPHSQDFYPETDFQLRVKSFLMRIHRNVNISPWNEASIAPCAYYQLYSVERKVGSVFLSRVTTWRNHRELPLIRSSSLYNEPFCGIVIHTRGPRDTFVYTDKIPLIRAMCRDVTLPRLYSDDYEVMLMQLHPIFIRACGWFSLDIWIAFKNNWKTRISW